MSESLSHIEQPGLLWKEGLFGVKPVWTAEPSIETIKTLITRHFHLSEAPDVSFFAEGAFNKLYAVTCSRGDFIFRVTLPLAPNVKTKSESATTSFIRDTTTTRTPVVFAYDASLSNELGFEWMIMERMDGRPLREQWHKLSWLKKQLLVQQVIDLIAQLDHTKWDLIGSLYQGSPYRIGQAVHPAFFIQDHIKLPIYRGPFPSSNSLVTAHMQHLQYDITKQLASSDKDDVKDAENMQEIYELLEPLIPRLFPPTPSKTASDEISVLFHPDLSANNILVNDDGDLTAIVDWENVIAAPPWLSCQLPEFLEGPSISCTSCPDPVPADDPDAVEFYHEQLCTYEKAQLRRFFLEEMERRVPGWVQTFRRESTRRDILVAIELTGSGDHLELVKGWATALRQKGEVKVSLTDALRKED